MSLGLGEIEIKLVDKPGGELTAYTLKPTLRAAKMISRSKGGYLAVANALGSLDFDMIQYVIDHGIGLTDKGREGLDQRVYETGLTDLAAPLVRFVHILANGGKPPKDPNDDNTEKGESGGNS
jgi:hypothetical protein